MEANNLHSSLDMMVIIGDRGGEHVYERERCSLFMITVAKIIQCLWSWMK